MQFGWRWRSWRAPGGRTVRPTTRLSDPAVRSSIRNWTCMSIQPSSSRRPRSSGTSSIVVRYGSAIIHPSHSAVSLVNAHDEVAAGAPELRAALSISEAAAQVGTASRAAARAPAASTRSFCWSSTSANTSVSSHEQRRPVADHGRRDHALQHRVDDRFSVDARLLDQRDALGERGHGDDEREVDRDLRQDRLAVRPDVGDLRPDRVEDLLDAFERVAVTADHHRHLARGERRGAAGDGAVEKGRAGGAHALRERDAGVRRDRADVRPHGTLAQARRARRPGRRRSPRSPRCSSAS